MSANGIALTCGHRVKSAAPPSFAFIISHTSWCAQQSCQRSCVARAHGLTIRVIILCDSNAVHIDGTPREDSFRVGISVLLDYAAVHVVIAPVSGSVRECLASRSIQKTCSADTCGSTRSRKSLPSSYEASCIVCAHTHVAGKGRDAPVIYKWG